MRPRRILEGIDARVATVLLTAALVLIFLEYAAVQPVFINRVDPSRPIPFHDLARWALLSFAAYTLVPALVALVAFDMKPWDFGLTFKGVGRHLPLYFVLYLFVLPFVYMASRQPAFLQTYPFARSAANGPVPFVEWELLYGLQFLGLEFFFRGFLVFGLKHKFGINAVFVMVVPYCMIHFHKPMPEAIGAIGAGLILGILAYRTRSILGGVMIHWSVAITMDVLAILGHGGFR